MASSSNIWIIVFYSDLCNTYQKQNHQSSYRNFHWLLHNMCLTFINSPIILKPGWQECLKERQTTKTGIPGFYLCPPDMPLSTPESGTDYFTSNVHLWFLVPSLNSCKPPTSSPHTTLCQRFPWYCIIHKSTFPHQSWKTFLLCHPSESAGELIPSSTLPNLLK